MAAAKKKDREESLALCVDEDQEYDVTLQIRHSQVADAVTRRVGVGRCWIRARKGRARSVHARPCWLRFP